MSLEMEYDTIFQVIDAWEQLRRVDNYEQGKLRYDHLAGDITVHQQSTENNRTCLIF